MDSKLADIQAWLRAAGYNPGPVDGVWGSQTRDAIAAVLGVKARIDPTVDAPWLDLARQEIGIKETPGAGNTEAVAAYFKASVGAAYADSVAWCAAFVGAMLAESGYKPSGSLMARSYLDWGTKLAEPRRGAVVVFKRGAAPAGHVAFVDYWSDDQINCIGGNQGDRVSESVFARSSVLGYRWPSEVAA